MTLILTASELEALSDMPATVAAVERAFGAIAGGTAHQPAPISLRLASSDSRFLGMAALADAEQLASIKLLADIPANAERGMPTQRSTIVLVSQTVGEPLAVLDGRVPTRVRTAAASAVASKYLARPNSTVLGLIGAGALATAHVEAMLTVLPIDSVVVWSRTRQTTEAFARTIAHHGLQVTIAESVRQVVESVDVLCTLTPAREPLVYGRWFRPGLHINAVGARPRPDHREIDSEGMAHSRIFVDSMDTSVEKSGDLIIPVHEGAMAFENVQAELGDVVAGTKPGRTADEEITLFNSVGIGLLDLAIGRLLYDKALGQDVGLKIDLSR